MVPCWKSWGLWRSWKTMYRTCQDSLFESHSFYIQFYTILMEISLLCTWQALLNAHCDPPKGIGTPNEVIFRFQGIGALKRSIDNYCGISVSGYLHRWPIPGCAMLHGQSKRSCRHAGLAIRSLLRVDMSAVKSLSGHGNQRPHFHLHGPNHEVPLYLLVNVYVCGLTNIWDNHNIGVVYVISLDLISTGDGRLFPPKILKYAP